MASFQAKTGWKRPKRRENKKLSLRSVPFQPDAKLKIPKKKAIKLKKIKI